MYVPVDYLSSLVPYLHELLSFLVRDTYVSYATIDLCCRELGGNTDILKVYCFAILLNARSPASFYHFRIEALICRMCDPALWLGRSDLVCPFLPLSLPSSAPSVSLLMPSQPRLAVESTPSCVCVVLSTLSLPQSMWTRGP